MSAASADGPRKGRAAHAVDRLAANRAVRAVGLHPVVARPGYWLATAAGVTWGALLGGFRVSRRGGVIVCAGLPRWAFGRGGTTIGAAYLTRDNTRPEVLEHEAVHRAQWRRYGLAFIPLYFAAGLDGRTNRFEIEAGLEKGGYR
ncbi:hypothetical protein [Microcella frigidaquae]|uniref:Fe-S oxidoreductase n=1 Tax=Microcella frigidaquae TaxID=424758 RepID=A0A840XK01_9MICO|nr:hypothetical protein [Microcella frigidaquae]